MKHETHITNGDAIVAELVQTNYCTSFPCGSCGGIAGRVPVLAVVITGEYQGFKVCESCIRAGKDALEKIISAHAANLEGEAARLRGMIGRLKVPTYQEWKKAMADLEKKRIALHPVYTTTEEAF